MPTCGAFVSQSNTLYVGDTTGYVYQLHCDIIKE